jgi:hypothetical protein
VGPFGLRETGGDLVPLWGNCETLMIGAFVQSEFSPIESRGSSFVAFAAFVLSGHNTGANVEKFLFIGEKCDWGFIATSNNPISVLYWYL